ncbi:MAG: PTS sugar transporter subunit IIA [Phycisphaerales bacterium]|nr:MAG: PTS sugar transporter subunit IIA [Phycisphaerales bacterium]
MNLLDILTPASIKVPLAATDKKSAIFELVDTLRAAGKVSDAPQLKEAVWAREQARSTGIGHGLAIPHGKSTCVRDLAMAIGKPAEGMDFSSIDQKPVRLIVLLASPVDRTSDHIQALAKISRLMTVADFRDRVYAAESAEEMYDLFQSQEVAT